MMEPLAIDWRGMFLPALGLPEIFVRGTIMYLAMFVILRFIARRQAGSFGSADLLVIVLIADAAQNGLGKDYTSVTEGIALVLTIVGWEYVLDWLAWKYPSLRPWLNAPPLKLVEDGRPVKASLDRELLPYDELMAQLREHEVEKIEEVRVAYLEGDGRLSVLKKRAGT
jgi:uncharacterized membrane protein YcaP (DUF421 family)